MTVVIVIEKSGTVKELSIKNFSVEELYKKAGFKSQEGFEVQTSWSVDVVDKQYEISLYAKKTGRSGQENKYDLPPPVDSSLYFGNMVLLNRKGSEDLKKKDWDKIYEHLFGGFEDVNSQDSEDDFDSDLDDDIVLTKDGYVKDDFIIDSDESEEEEEEEPYEEEEEEIKPKKRKVKTVVKKEKKVSKKETKQKVEEQEDMDLDNELEPEEYINR
jgi:hypothetical protein